MGYHNLQLLTTIQCCLNCTFILSVLTLMSIAATHFCVCLQKEEIFSDLLIVFSLRIGMQS